MKFNPILSSLSIITMSFIITYCNIFSSMLENQAYDIYVIIESICSFAILTILIWKKYKQISPKILNYVTLLFLCSLEILIWSATQQTDKNLQGFQIQILILFIGKQQSFQYFELILIFSQMLNIVDFKQTEVVSIEVGVLVFILILSNCYYLYQYSQMYKLLQRHQAGNKQINLELEQTLQLPLSNIDNNHSVQISKRLSNRYDQELNNLSNTKQQNEFKTLFQNQKIISIYNSMEIEEVNFEISQYFDIDHQHEGENLKDFFNFQASIVFEKNTKTIKELLKEIYGTIKQCVMVKIKKQPGCNFKNVYLIIYPLPQYYDIKIIIHFIDFQQKYMKLKERQKQVLNDTFKSLSHELGTNLNSILTYSTVALNDPNLPTNICKNYIRPIQINSQQLNLIVSNIRDYNSINMQEFDLKIEEFRIDLAIHKINQLFTDILREKNIKLNIQIQFEKKKIVSDSNRFSQVYFQILQNSIKYTRNEKICVRVSKIYDLIEIVITDGGEGVTQVEFEQVNKILNQSEFVRVSSKSVGIGMGLGISNAIVKQLNHNNSPIICQQKSIGVQFTFTIKNHNQELENIAQRSQIEFQSSISSIRVFSQNLYFEGHSKQHINSYRHMPTTPITKSKFRTIIRVNNIEKCKSDTESITNQLNDDESFKIQKAPLFITQQYNSIVDCNMQSNCCSRVLLIDDEYFNIQCLTLLLRPYKTLCDSAYNGQEALDKIEQKLKNPCKQCGNQHYALIFFDINMPIMDGYECVQEVQKWIKSEKIRKCWCVANSGFSDLPTKVKAYQSGMDFYITKPINHVELKEFIAKMFPQKQISLFYND